MSVKHLSDELTHTLIIFLCYIAGLSEKSYKHLQNWYATINPLNAEVILFLTVY